MIGTNCSIFKFIKNRHLLPKMKVKVDQFIMKVKLKLKSFIMKVKLKVTQI